MTQKELMKALKQGDIGPLYLFTGPERLLMEQALQTLRDQLVDPAYADFNLVWIEGDEDSPESLFQALETLPFLSERKLVIVKDAPYFKAQQDKLSDAQRERLEAALNTPAADTCLVFLAGQTDKRKRASKALAAQGHWVEFGKLERPDYEKWLLQQAEARKSPMGQADLKYLVEMTGYLDKNSEDTLLDVVQSLERLFSYTGEGRPVTRKEIDQVFEKPLEYNIFMMVDAIADGNASEALRMLKELLDDGEAEIKILFMIARHYRILLRVALSAEAGYTGKDMASKVGVPPFLVKKYMAQASRLGMKSIASALNALLETDRSVKTGRMDPLIGLEVLVVRLGG